MAPYGNTLENMILDFHLKKVFMTREKEPCNAAIQGNYINKAIQLAS